MIRFDKTLSQQKDVLLNYFRDSATASLAEVSQKFGVNQFKERASAINKEIKETADLLSQTLLQEAKNRQWDKRQMLDSVLMLNHVRNVVMLETRNDVWRYDYMAFSRRIGEIWEPFCKLCFDYPINDIQPFIPPLFSQVKEKLHNEIDEYIDGLKLSESQKQDLKQYYEKVWSMVASGEIKLQLDLHFKVGGGKVNIDFKSGFGSNEKGNTNRLLMVATIYKNLEENYTCTILVRSAEDKNNHYFKTLKNSSVWNAYCGEDAYNKIAEYTGFDLKEWIDNNIDWENDLKRTTVDYFKEQNLFQYLSW